MTGIDRHPIRAALGFLLLWAAVWVVGNIAQWSVFGALGLSGPGRAPILVAVLAAALQVALLLSVPTGYAVRWLRRRL